MENIPKAGKKDHPDEILWVYPPRRDEENYWCKEYGSIKIPRGWVFLSAGDAFVTRQVKGTGLYWIEVQAAKAIPNNLVSGPQGKSIGNK